SPLPTSRRMSSAPAGRREAMTDLAWLTIADASRMIRERQLSPVEYAAALFGRARTLDPSLNVYIRTMEDSAMAEAKRAEEEVAQGKWRGPLHGIPCGLKDIIDVEGVPTTAHSKVMADNIARSDANVTRRLR